MPNQTSSCLLELIISFNYKLSEVVLMLSALILKLRSKPDQIRLAMPSYNHMSLSRVRRLRVGLSECALEVNEKRRNKRGIGRTEMSIKVKAVTLRIVKSR